MTAIREHRLVLNGRSTRYRTAGQGPDVVLVHGLGLSSRFWLRHYPLIADHGFRAIAPDLPGFGESSGPRTGLSVPETARWLLDFADALDLDRAAWLGHSIAAQPTLHLAACAPERASAIVLASPTGAPGRFRLSRQVVGLLRDIAREPLELVPAVLREYVHTTVAAYLGTWIRAADDDPLAVASRVRCPTLLAVGYRDPLVPAGYIAALRRSLPVARIARIEDGAHGVAYGRARDFSRAVGEFLGDVLG